MTSTERLYALYSAVRYIVLNDIPGDFVECGVWRGGSVMLIALALQSLGIVRHIYCFDTFSGMPDPGIEDVRHQDGAAANALLNAAPRDEDSVFWAIAPLKRVKANVASTGYPMSEISFVVGKVEDSIPGNAPDHIALLRLDTDWYTSTKHELEHLYPRLTQQGVLIVDDYGFWRGSRQAVDEYLAGRLLLNRIDDTGRLGIKPASARFRGRLEARITSLTGSGNEENPSRSKVD